MQRKKCFLIAVLLVLLTGFAASIQPIRVSLGLSASAYLPPIDWVKSVGLGDGTCVRQTSDGGFIIAGNEDATSAGCWLARTDESGNSQWEKTYFKSGFEVAGRASQETLDGGFMLAGFARNTSYSGAYLDAWLIQTDEFGNSEWNKTYQGEGNAVAFSGQQTSDGGYAFAGWTAPVGVNDEDFYLVKTDSSGIVEWSKTYGGSSNEVAWSLQQTIDSGYILAGYTYSFGAGGSDCWLVKTDANGNMEWNKTYGSSLYDETCFVRQTEDGGYVFVGFENYGGGGYWTGKYAYVAKTNSSGEIEWKDGFSGEDYPAGKAWAEAYSVDETSDGGFIITGEATLSTGERTMFLMKTHSQGNGTDWRGTYAGYAGGRDVIQTVDGSFAVAGGSGLVKIMSESVVILARFTYSPENPIVNETIVFNATYSYHRNQDIVQYVWDFDDGNSSSTSNPVVLHRYDRPRAYNVSLMVIDAEGLNSSHTEIVNIPSGQPIAHFEYSPNNPVLQENVIFDASSSYDRNLDIVSYLWDFDDGNISSVMNPIIVHRYENAGIYNVSLRVIDAEGLNSTCSVVLCAKMPTLISLSTSTPPATTGYSVNISGILHDLCGSEVRNEKVDLYYAYSGYESWNLIASVNSDTSGSFTAWWIPPTPSYFVIKAVYVGNYTHVGFSKNVTLSILPYGTEYLFSVESNSTIGSMGFDSNNQTLRFIATGAEGTKGYGKVTMAKSLVSNLTLLRVSVDGVESDYNVTDADSSWVLLFVYDHSAHQITLQLDYTVPEFTSVLLVLFMATTLFAAIFCKKKTIHGCDEDKTSPKEN